MRTNFYRSLAVGLLGLSVTMGSAATSSAANPFGLTPGHAELKSTGPMAFGPQGVLFIADTKAAAIVAVATEDTKSAGDATELKLEDVGAAVAKTLGANAQEVQIDDMVINPETGNAFLAVSVGAEAKKPAVVKIDGTGQISQLDLQKLDSGRAQLPNPPEDREAGQGNRRRNSRNESITDLAFVDGFVIVSGLTNAQASSAVRSLAFPFAEADSGATLEIFHAAHGRVEDNAPIRTFVPFIIDGKPNLLAGFTCTPLVKFPLGDLEAGKKVRGTTVAELGNRNRPLDMIVYKKDGQNYLLMANSARGVMKISTENIERSEGLTEPVEGGGTAGQPYETIESLKGVVQLDRLNDHQAVILVQNDGGPINLQTIELP